MGVPVLIMGESGSGKTYSIKNLYGDLGLPDRLVIGDSSIVEATSLSKVKALKAGTVMVMGFYKCGDVFTLTTTVEGSSSSGTDTSKNNSTNNNTNNNTSTSGTVKIPDFKAYCKNLIADPELQIRSDSFYRSYSVTPNNERLINDYISLLEEYEIGRAHV